MTNRKTPIMIIGCGGLAREVYSLLMQCDNWEILAWRGEPRHDGEKIYGLPVLPHELDYSRVFHVFAIGDVTERYNLYDKYYKSKNYVFPTIIHPSAIMGKNVEIGEGTVITQRCIITCDAKIGRFVYLNILSEVAHDVIVEDFVTIGPNCSINGKTKIGRMTYIGTDVALRDGKEIGNNCLIGMGSVIVGDIPPYSLVMGVPGKVVRKLEH